jgi:hypothetical protein
MSSASETETAIAYLRSPLAIRARCENVLDAAVRGRLAHFSIDLAALPRVIDEVVTVTRERYPTLEIPVHGRINHFRTGGADRVAELDGQIKEMRPDDRARIWIDLIVVSVLLDAGAGERWRYREARTGLTLRRAEARDGESFRAP